MEKEKTFEEFFIQFSNRIERSLIKLLLFLAVLTISMQWLASIAGHLPIYSKVNKEEGIAFQIEAAKRWMEHGESLQGKGGSW